jgi:hypothetical protein
MGWLSESMGKVKEALPATLRSVSLEREKVAP